MLTMLAGGTLAYSACPNSEQQDVDSILRAFARSWRNSDYVASRAAGAQLSNPDLRNRTEQLLLFAEARVAIKNDDFGAASQIFRRLESGAKRALIAAALARRHTESEALRKRWLRIALSDADRLPEAQRKDLLAIILPVVIEADAGLGLRLLDTAIHEQTKAARAKPTTETQQQSVIVAAGAQLLEIVPGRTSKHVFMLGVPGMSRPDLRDLAVAHHAHLRCIHRTRHNVSGGQRTAGGRLPPRSGNSD
jgi:hypothetical protein